jgi:hypothetical protein
MTTILLPPLPLPHFGAPWNPPMVFTEDQLRARDLEVAKAVLEGAAKVCGRYSEGQWFASSIRALEVKHHE